MIWPGDSGPHRHVVLFKLHHFITAFFFLNDKSGIKTYMLTLPASSCVCLYTAGVRMYMSTVFKAKKSSLFVHARICD